MVEAWYLKNGLIDLVKSMYDNNNEKEPILRYSEGQKIFF